MCNFESFSEDSVPRRVPQPILLPALDNSKPIVPEISLIIDDSREQHTNQPKKATTYKEWKHQQTKDQHLQNRMTNGKHTSTNVTVERKKYVQFDLKASAWNNSEPAVVGKHIRQTVDTNPLGKCQQLDLSLCEPQNGNNCSMIQVTDSSDQQFVRNSTFNPPSDKLHQQTEFYFDQKRKFVPNMQQSIQNPNATSHAQRFRENDGKEITLNDIYQLLSNIQKSTQNREEQPRSIPQQIVGPHFMPQHAVPQSYEQISHGRKPGEINQLTSSEPTIKDLFGVIVKQQEQLMNIQNQVNMLLMNSNNAVGQPINSMPNQFFGGPCNIQPHPNQMGVMTSFEINVQSCQSRPPQQNSNSYLTPNVNYQNGAATNSKRNLVCSCECGCSSTNKQNSSTSSENNEENGNPTLENDNENPSGWTFYGNILNQVNNVLQNSPQVDKPTQNPVHVTNTNDENNLELNTDNNFTPNFTKSIRTAQFKQVGFRFDDVNISATSKRITFGSTPHKVPQSQSEHNRSTEKSMLMNALANKYLQIEGQPNDGQLPNLPQHRVMQPHITYLDAATEQSQTATAKTDMSISSYQYMQKYGLL